MPVSEGNKEGAKPRRADFRALFYFPECRSASSFLPLSFVSPDVALSGELASIASRAAAAAAAVAKKFKLAELS